MSQACFDDECQTPALTTEQAMQAIEMFRSHKVTLSHTALPFRTEIIITDYTAEESEIDKLVYQLYHLTNDEIALIEQG